MKSKFLNKDTEEEFKVVLAALNKQFDSDLTLEGILFLIGVQELGKGFKKFKKDDKLNLMHIAICTLLEPYGYYSFEGEDPDGYPHWALNENLPPLKAGEQMQLVKEASIEYFKRNGILSDADFKNS